MRFDTVVMGRGTYEPGLAIGVTSPYSHLRQYVFSSALTATDPDVHVVSEDPVEFVRNLKLEDGLGIWLCGGGKLAAVLRGEIDELVIKRHPMVLGAGIPLFDGPFEPTRFRLASTQTFDAGVQFVTYVRPRDL